MVNNRNGKWTSCIILRSTLDEVKKLCNIQENGFANSSQFISYAVRKELDRLKER
ncbi:hypothetical protein [Nitrosopumilus sp.]|uniref:hypothetical protein n=1 Tax=Nitrosopumilus sp. TaxID=2024843 RepID=UPI0034A254DB